MSTNQSIVVESQSNITWMERLVSKKQIKGNREMQTSQEILVRPSPSEDSVGEEKETAEKIKQYTRFLRICFQSIGMMPIFPYTTNIFLQSINIFFMLFINFISIHIGIFSIADLLVRWDGNIFNLTFNMINTIIYITNTVLLFYFQFNNQRFLDLLNNLDDTFRFCSGPGLTKLDMTASFKKARFLSVTFVISCLVGALHWAFMPLFYPVDETGQKALPIKVWYPIDVQQSPFYEMAYFFQFIGQIMVAMVFANFGILFLSGCILICGQFDILCCSLRNLRYAALLRNGYPLENLVALTGYSLSGPNRCTLPEEEDGQYQGANAEILDVKLKESLSQLRKEELYSTGSIEKPSSQRPQRSNDMCLFRRKVSFKDWEEIKNYDNITGVYEDYKKEVAFVLIDCIQHHQEILKFCRCFQSFLSIVSMFKMFQITLLMCVIMYSISVSFQITILEYGSLTLTDLFVLCYFGNEVRLKSCKVGEVACTAPWHIMDKKLLRLLMPLTIRASRPVLFSGGSFYMLNLENYIGVLKASFSYYTLLRNMNEAKNQHP